MIRIWLDIFPELMSNLLAYIEQNRQESKRLIGLEYEQLQQLTEQAQLLHRNKQLEIDKTKVRIIKGGGGRKAKLQSMSR
jgi:hypothetical protein